MTQQAGFSIRQHYCFHPVRLGYCGKGRKTVGSATIMAVYLCNRSLNARVDPRVLSEMSQIIAPMLYLYALLRGIDLATHGAAPYLFKWREESLLFWFEIALFVIAPVFLLSQSRVRNNPDALYGTCALVVMAFMANRLDVSITAFQASSGFYYRSQVDRICSHACHRYGCWRGLPLRREIPGDSSQKRSRE